MTEGHPSVAGFRFSGICCGIKPEGEPDLGLVVADQPAATAAVFTENRVRAAPVEVASARVERGRAQAILVNSGSANACTGKDGMESARSTTEAVGDALDLDSSLVLPASTGTIGVPLPAERIRASARDLTQALRPDGVEDFARAILTTDKGPKIAHKTIQVGGGTPATILGVAKGAGMIHPQMATTLAFVVTDAPMHSSFLNRSLRKTVDRTLNRISVDGDTSTNDAVFLMTSARVQAEPLHTNDRDSRVFQDALTEVLDQLGRMIVADGEGAEHVVRIEVVGAPSEDAGQKVAERIATSPLVKTALYGGDPNWGRILSAAGMAGVVFDPSKVELRFDDAIVVRKGIGGGPPAEAQAREVMKQPEYRIVLDLGAGHARAHYTTCDLGHEYVRVNSSYRS
jgi:glutamate N-acetyltransferase/amino-acid N-acetyltransferase